MDEQEAKLPVWARDLIADLHRRIQYYREPAIKDLTRLRLQVELLTAHNGALIELLQCASRGGHMASQEIVNVLEGYDLSLKEK